MCKLTILNLEKAKKPHADPSGDWTLYLLECLVKVDGADPSAVRMVKTFDKDVYQQIMKLDEGKELTFEAEMEGEKPNTTFMIKKPKKATTRRAAAKGPTNRQTALSIAVELERARSSEDGELPTPERILVVADTFLQWLEVKD
jgi:hypothetical protein